MEKVAGIYKIENKINHKIYIGQTNNLDKRKAEHFNELNNNKHFNYYLQRSVNKYGIDNFDFVVLQTCDNDRKLLNELETYWWVYYSKLVGKENMYNLAHTGNAHNTSETTRKNLSISHKGLVPPNKGKKASAETVEKLRISHLGQVSANKGKHPSVETRRKISEHQKGRIPWNKGIPMSEEQKKKVSQGKKGQTYGKMSAEHKTNLVKSLKLAWKRRKEDYGIKV